MVYKTRIDPKGPTRHLGRRGALKQTTFVRLKKAQGLLTVESALEVMLLSLLDLSNQVVEIQYQPFTIDVANNRLFQTHQDLKNHRQALRDAGRTGIFYTPDIQATLQIACERTIEVIEAKDSDWIPSEDDYYGQKLITAKELLESRGVGFNLYEASNRGLYQSPLSNNVNKLHCAKMQRENALGTLSNDYLEYLQNRERMLDVLSRGPQTICELAKQCAVQTTTVWHLFIDELVTTDLQAKALGPSTMLQLPATNTSSAASLFYTTLLSLRTSSMSSTVATQAIPLPLVMQGVVYE
ncbi:hypothetical protein [Limnobacter sp.]|uniref:hypothetical protein n=1 Tax=Limnobacter sp. TaxID=2003368 RepID=UPI00258AFCD0|nr:hypothetical protein [Limnobacter sp.]